MCMCVFLCVLCCFSINRCQCGAALAGQSVAANVTSMTEKKIEKESNRLRTAESASDKKEKALAEPQPSYLPCPCILCPCIIDKMYGGRCVELQAVIL